MVSAQQTLERFFLEMRWRCVSLAADLDRIQRCDGGLDLLKSDPRVQKLHAAFKVLLADQPARAQQVEMIFSDLTPPPAKP